MVANQSVAAIASSAGSAQTLVLGAADDENATTGLLVKFFFRKFELIPVGIPRVDRQPNYNLDAARQLEAFKIGQKELAVSGRVRKNRVDTGNQVITVNRPVHAGLLRCGIANNGFRLTHLHWFMQGDDLRDQRSQKEPVYVVCACFVRQLQNALPDPARVQGLRELAKLTFGTMYGWDNPAGNPATLNFRGVLAGQKPKHSIAVRGGNVVVLDVAENLPEGQE